MLIECEYCGNGFDKSQAEINRTTHNYCSKLCFRTAKANSTIVKCEECGKEFKKMNSAINRTDRNFCSNACRFKDRNKRVEVECETCGKKHFKQQYSVLKNVRNFCCQECFNNFEGNKVKKICPYCKKEFLDFPSGIKVCCSTECSNKYVKLQETDKRSFIKCNNCGIDILRNNIKAENNEHNFCSYCCMGEFRKNNENSYEPFYFTKIWKDLRVLALERDKKMCVDCGVTEVKFSVHHIMGRKQGGKDELDNLVTLCTSCHMKRHLKDIQNGAKNIKLKKYKFNKW